MHPVLFSIGHVHAYGYGLMIAIGALVAIFVSQWRANRRCLNGDLVFNTALLGLIVGLLGAKLTFILSNIKLLFSDPAYVLGSDGFTVYGGVVLGILAGVLYLRHKKVSIPVYLDLMIPQIPLAQGFGRIGCFLAGCCYGKPTDSVLGVVFPPEAIAPSGISLWPTQLLSSAGDFLIFLVLLLLSNYATWYLNTATRQLPPDAEEVLELKEKFRILQPGSIGGLYLVLYGIGRFLIEFLRNDPRRMLGGLTSNQYVSIVCVAAGIALMLALYTKEKKKNADVTSSSKP